MVGQLTLGIITTVYIVPMNTDIRFHHGEIAVLMTTVGDRSKLCTGRSVIPNLFLNQLELYPTNSSGITSHLFVKITFEKCPIGFEPSNSTGEYICDHSLW